MPSHLMCANIISISVKVTECLPFGILFTFPDVHQPTHSFKYSQLVIIIKQMLFRVGEYQHFNISYV